MKVSQLIKELKKMPKNAQVYNVDHDHGEYEVNGSTRAVKLVEKQYAHELEERSDSYEDMPDVWVSIRV